MSDDLTLKTEDEILLEADRDIDEYKRQINRMANPKPVKYKVNKKLLLVIKITSVLIILMLIATRML